MADLRPDTRAAKAALTELAATPGEMLTLLTVLTGSAPAAVIAAVDLVKGQRAASSGETRMSDRPLTEEAIRAHERRHRAEEIAIAIETVGASAKAYHYRAAIARAARIARQMGEVR